MSQSAGFGVGQQQHLSRVGVAVLDDVDAAGERAALGSRIDYRGEPPPDAGLSIVVLCRHPVAVADSIRRAGDARDLEAAGAVVDKFAAALEQTWVPEALAITCEELTAAPEDTCRTLCRRGAACHGSS